MTPNTETKVFKTSDNRDNVSEEFARVEALLDMIVSLTSERDAYRLLAKQAIHHCHALYADVAGLRAHYKRLLSDIRVLRSQLFGRDGRAA